MWPMSTYRQANPRVHDNYAKSEASCIVVPARGKLAKSALHALQIEQCWTYSTTSVESRYDSDREFEPVLSRTANHEN